MTDSEPTISANVTPDAANWMRPLGNTGLRVSAITVGGAPLGSMPELFGYATPEEQAITLVEAVCASPIRSIDTANMYGDGRSELRIAAGLTRAGATAEGMLITTKVDGKDGDYSGARVRESVTESLARLRVEYLPLVYLHDPEYAPDAGFERPGGAIEALVELRNRGVVGHIGIAGGHVPTMNRLIDTGAFEVLLTHSRATLVDGSANELIDRAKAMGMGVANAAVYGGGLLASRTAPPLYSNFKPAHPEVLSATSALFDLADEFGIELADAAAQHSLRDSRIDTTIVGMSKPKRVPLLLAGLTVQIPDDFWQRAAELMPDKSLWVDAHAN
ncbi:aldo/keto reductase [Microbacterium sp. LWS13-1.2]|uniref:Aldo/keto reductase n=1 Tax=Microbacterium sp. LWS13-1.2 TaxID=3135264 RepID=A0AAU6SBP4_9MICO